jgi:hypothetical protein
MHIENYPERQKQLINKIQYEYESRARVGKNFTCVSRYLGVCVYVRRKCKLFIANSMMVPNSIFQTHLLESCCQDYIQLQDKGRGIKHSLY